MRLETRIERGRPYASIARYAAEHAVDLVVLGRHGRRLVRDLFIGSTAGRVIRASTKSVLVVHGPVTAGYRRPLVPVDLDESAPRSPL